MKEFARIIMIPVVSLLLAIWMAKEVPRWIKETIRKGGK